MGLNCTSVGTHLNTLTGTTSESSGEGRKPTKARSVAAERRKLVKLRSLHRKAVLDSENNYIYQQLPGGGFMAGMISWHFSLNGWLRGDAF